MDISKITEAEELSRLLRSIDRVIKDTESFTARDIEISVCGFYMPNIRKESVDIFNAKVKSMFLDECYKRRSEIVTQINSI